MKMWINKLNCTGCGACQNICSKKAILMKEDNCGFKYPDIDSKKCINCGLCKKTCPIIEKKDINNENNIKVYAAWSKDIDNRFNSTSGGIFTEISKEILGNNGYIVGAKYNNENMVEHSIINDIKGLKELRQSKYVQSDTNNIYSITKKYLDENKLLAFCGSPCQIAGLNKFLNKNYDNLLTIEFICRGMNSPKAYKEWLKEIEQKNKKKIVKVWFKYKINGWKTSPKCTRIDFHDGTYKVYNGVENYYMYGYLGPNLYIRQCCGNCKFNGLPRQADITLADFWGIEKELDDDKGTSLVIINSLKGQDYFDKISSNLKYFEKKLEDIYSGNMCFDKSVEINPKSEEFLKSLDNNKFSSQIKKYCKLSFFKRIYIKIKDYYKKFE